MGRDDGLAPLVVIPFGDPRAPRRTENLRFVQHHYAENFPSWPRLLYCDTMTPVTPGKMRNRGAVSGKGDPLIFNDADSIVPPEQIREAVRLAADAPGLVFAYTDYIRLNEHDEPIEHLPNAASHGCVAISRACFEEVGGYDERFVGWGYEDCAFTVACARLWPIRRVHGPLRHLWHPPSDERLEHERDVPTTAYHHANLALYEAEYGGR